MKQPVSLQRILKMKLALKMKQNWYKDYDM